ncbi:hypothetical protein EV122DRAFT_285231 [Schizophyllum commune]
MTRPPRRLASLPHPQAPLHSPACATILPDICDDVVCSPLSLPDLVSYSQICKDTHRTVQLYAHRAYKFKHCLAKFMDADEAEGLRNVMRETGTIISGSIALQFFSREPLPDSDLDLRAHSQLSVDRHSGVALQGYVAHSTGSWVALDARMPTRR